ncbi:histidine kinase-, DNA gyrase b-, and HSP90-like ATPase domain-containing protein [Sarocladium implicatum]|nr:histidine kinase-, DNA gyrase b-, and HSP90-like ATPase domain-containing protein [Sarocladium implicatum]
MATIKPIESRTVHQIQSGQVIVDLCSVVKELVENSVDSGATSIDVRFKNQGLDLIEVQDNGAGISPANYESLCLKHHTSKLSTYDDLTSLQTFGFRGEALASLCALSTLTVTTCLPDDVPKGTGLTFEPSGQLRGTSVVAAQRGTTVSVEKLFHNLPVRRRELDRNIKREWQKVIALLNQYACILTGLKFTVSQQPSKGKRIILFSTKGNATTRENIINIFSAKMTSSLVPLDLKLEMKPTAPGPTLQGLVSDNAQEQASREVHVVGHVSRPVHGEGRQTPDRQMFFVNGRPCGLPQFAKTFNEVYRAYSSNQSPFICADIQLDTDMYDVNVSPDKRTIMLHDQHQLLDNLRGSLIALFDDHDYIVPLASLSRNQGMKPEARPSHPSTFRFTRQNTSPDPPRPSQSEADDSAEDEEEGSTDEPHATRPIGHFARGSARRIPSANSISRGGPHSQSLIHQWVHDTTKKPRQRNSTDRPASPSGHAEEETGDDATDSGSAAQASEDDAPALANDKVERPAPILMDGHRPGEQDVEAATALSPVKHQDIDDKSIPSLEARMASESDDPLPPVRHSKRSAPELATVTIGSETKSSWIGSSSKRARRSTTPQSPDSPPRPSFGTRLTQMYASQTNSGTVAGGTGRYDQELQHKELEDDGEEEALERDYQEELKNPDDPASRVLQPSQSASENSDPSSDDRSPDGSEADTDRKTLAAEVPPASQDAQPRAAAFETARRRKDATTTLQQILQISEDALQTLVGQWEDRIIRPLSTTSASDKVEDITDPDAESKLSLVINRGDFTRMRVAGQFNLGFIIAIRPSASLADDLEAEGDDELFIIDQHASDEKYNFERLQSETIVQSQRLVQPKRLELTALEEEIIMQNLPALEANGFKVDIDTSGDSPVGARCQLLALPLSRETTFNLTDLEELISLLGETSNESMHVPRPAKVRKMFAMRACRSSVMIGKALTQGQMYGLVKHMGEMDKPWNCPHGRPTMRHLCQLKAWDQKGWKDDTGVISRAAWADYALE